jgi:hypothetical protein
MTSALAQHPSHFTPGKDPVHIVQEAGWDPGLVWMSAKNLAPTGIRSLERPAHSQSPYELGYPGPLLLPNTRKKRKEENELLVKCYHRYYSKDEKLQSMSWRHLLVKFLDTIYWSVIGLTKINALSYGFLVCRHSCQICNSHISWSAHTARFKTCLI